MAPLSDHFVTSSVNKFYAIGNKIVVNASVFMDSSPETQSVTVRPTLQKQLAYIIQQRNNNLGMSRLWVEGSSNPVTAILGKWYTRRVLDFRFENHYACQCIYYHFIRFERVRLSRIE